MQPFSCVQRLISMIQRVKTLAVWGDSILKGIVQGYGGKRFGICDDNCLKLAGDELGINVINHCYFGGTITKGKSIMMRDIEKGIECDSAIIEFGGNDCNYDWKAVCAQRDVHHEPYTPLKEFISHMQDMINLARENNIRPILMTLPPLEPNRYYKTISHGLDDAYILQWLGDAHYLYRWQEMYSLEAAKLALKNNCFMIDMRKTFLAEHNYQRLICEDGIHPNEEGHKFMADVLIEVTREARRENVKIA